MTINTVPTLIIKTNESTVALEPYVKLIIQLNLDDSPTALANLRNNTMSKMNLDIILHKCRNQNTWNHTPTTTHVNTNLVTTLVKGNLSPVIKSDVIQNPTETLALSINN